VRDGDPREGHRTHRPCGPARGADLGHSPDEDRDGDAELPSMEVRTPCLVGEAEEPGREGEEARGRKLDPVAQVGGDRGVSAVHDEGEEHEARGEGQGDPRAAARVGGGEGGSEEDGGGEGVQCAARACIEDVHGALSSGVSAGGGCRRMDCAGTRVRALRFPARVWSAARIGLRNVARIS
jgi:hypothetical protein